MKFKKVRDLHWTPWVDGQQLVVGCDSLGGIGPLSNDLVACSAEISGYFTAVVTLAELMAYGAKPTLVVDNLCFSLEPHGTQAIQGIRRALLEAGVPECPITGSTEENMPVGQTGLGITILGVALEEERSRRIVKPGDSCYLIGTPYVGEEVLQHLEEIRTIKHLTLFQTMQGTFDLLPVGSKGIRAEMDELSSAHGLEWISEELAEDFISKSAGPATCFLVAGAEVVLKQVIKEHGLPAMRIGFFR
jgi:thiamine monophosphate kinase